MTTRPTEHGHTPKSLRARLDLTISALAEAASVSTRTIQRIERGQAVGMGRLERVADALGVTVPELAFAWDRVRTERAE